MRNECDPALALLSDYVLHNSNVMRLGAIFGLGLAYAGSNRSDVLELLMPVLADTKSNMEVGLSTVDLTTSTIVLLGWGSVSNILFY